MIKKVLQLLTKYREQLLYLIFGALTTLVDWSISFVLYHFWGDAIRQNVYLIHAANVIAWTAAVLFAYVTNRRWVFGSARRGVGPVLCELGMFAGGRVFTLLLQEGFFFVFFDLLACSKYAVKILASVAVTVCNYFISKLVVFRGQKNKKSDI